MLTLELDLYVALSSVPRPVSSFSHLREQSRR